MKGEERHAKNGARTLNKEKVPSKRKIRTRRGQRAAGEKRAPAEKEGNSPAPMRVSDAHMAGRVVEARRRRAWTCKRRLYLSSLLCLHTPSPETSRRKLRMSQAGPTGEELGVDEVVYEEEKQAENSA